MSSAANEPPPQRENDGEVELWWGGYSAWTMLPSFAACALLTAVMIGIAYYLYSEKDVPGNHARFVVYGLALTVWLVALGVCWRRAATWNYRLTTRHLFLCKGLRLNSINVIELGDVKGIMVMQSTLERYTNVGQLWVATTRARLELLGVRQPHQIARMIEQQVNQLQSL